MAQLAPVPAAIVGHSFAKQYYDTQTKNPAILHKFYKTQSVFSSGEEGAFGDRVVSAVGQEEIQTEILAAIGGAYSSQVNLTGVDCQESSKGGILVLVTGFMTPVGGATQHFVQAFFLDKQTDPQSGYFVLNDVKRVLSSLGPAPEAAGFDLPDPQPNAVPQPQPAPAVPPAQPVAPQLPPSAPPTAAPSAAPTAALTAPQLPSLPPPQLPPALPQQPADSYYDAEVSGSAPGLLPQQHPAVEEQEPLPTEWPSEERDDQNASDGEEEDGNSLDGGAAASGDDAEEVADGGTSTSAQSPAAAAAAEKEHREDAGASAEEPKTWASMAGQLRQNRGQLGPSKALGFGLPPPATSATAAPKKSARSSGTQKPHSSGQSGARPSASGGGGGPRVVATEPADSAGRRDAAAIEAPSGGKDGQRGQRGKGQRSERQGGDREKGGGGDSRRKGGSKSGKGGDAQH